MSILNNNIIAGASANQNQAYNIQRSLRFRRSAPGYLSRTFSSSGSQTTWTWSGWVKRGSLGLQQNLMCAPVAGQAQGFQINETDNLQMVVYTGSVPYEKKSSAVLRDPSAWYHIVCVLDTTNATASDRVRMYINGARVTAFSASTDPAQNYVGRMGSNVLHQIGADNGGGNAHDGYMADVHFIDGQALTPASFGESDTVTGVWKPKRYTGTYGTNGFKLDFSDNSAATAAAIGKDSSGNGNNWTPNNISVTAGATYDSMTDVPTLTSETAANYPVFNPLFSVGTNGSLSNGNLTTVGGVNPCKVFFSTIAVKDSGKYYAEFTAIGSGNYIEVGVTDITLIAYNSGAIRGNGIITWDVNTFGGGYYLNSTTSTTRSEVVNANDVMMIAFDAATRNVWFGKNGVWNSSGNPSTGSSPAGAVNGSNELAYFARAEQTTIAANFGQRPFAYTPPSGFKALNTFNLPTPAILAGNKVMDATTYTGNGSTLTVTNAGGFKPDLIWTKSRSNAMNNQIQSSLQGADANGYLTMQTDATYGEPVFDASWRNTYGKVTAINSNGFTVAAGSSNGGFNTNGWSYVGWQWQAGQGVTSSNTSGSITSTVSVNPSAGFSVVTYTIPASGTGWTVGHGLGVAPSLIIAKARSNSTQWSVYHSSLGNTKYLKLNTTDSALTDSGAWNNTSPSSTVFTNGSAGFWGNSYTYVAYCWSEVAGFSKFGSYTGNGSTDGPFVYCGFRPKWIVWKNTNGTDHWYTYDTVRQTYNAMETYLSPSQSIAEATGGGKLDVLSNGFKVRNTGTDMNTNGSTYIYMAFAENPFKHSLAR